MGLDHVRVIRVHHRGLQGAAKEFVRVFKEILVQGVGLGQQDDEGVAAGPPHPAGPLPGGDHGAGIANQDADVQTADVDAHLQGAGGDHPSHPACGQGLLDLAALLRQIAGAIGADVALELRRQPLRPDMDELRELAGLGEADGIEALADGLGKDLGRDRGRPARGIEKEKVPAGLGGAACGDGFHLKPG